MLLSMTPLLSICLNFPATANVNMKKLLRPAEIKTWTNFRHDSSTKRNVTGS